MLNGLPYSDIFPELLIQVHKALGYCQSAYEKDELVEESDPKLEQIFSPLNSRYKQSGLNQHLIEGFNKKKGFHPRLVKITINAFYDAKLTSERSKNYKASVLPSPLYIIYHALTVPSEPQSAAYSFVICRTMLFYFLNLHPRHPDLEYINSSFDEFSESQIINSLSSFKKYVDIQARWPDNRLKSKSYAARVHYLNGHMMALKSVNYLWFRDEESILWFCSLDNIEKAKEYYCSPDKYQFRLSGRYGEQPDSSEVINWIFGLPIPIHGADILFYGGLKKTLSSGLVMSLHGDPGVGKTSIALSLAASLAPFNTTTVYITFEEDANDLVIRLETLTPDYLKDLSIYSGTKDVEAQSEDKVLSWFQPIKLSSDLSIDELTEFLQLLTQDIRDQEYDDDEDTVGNFYIPALCPLFIVIDNVNEFFSYEEFSRKKYNEAEKFIKQCQKMGALVVLIAAENIPKKVNLDYLVDVSIGLKQAGIKKQKEKPVRILQLIKTRHQISRQGSHVFHLSGSNGFRISPQVPSQLDKREKIKKLLANNEHSIQTLNILRKNGKPYYQDYLAVRSNSQILIHGYGSSGKAGFGLKLLLTPLIERDCQPLPLSTGDHVFKIKNQLKNKVLVVSFLYPEEYYQVLYRRIQKQLTDIYENYDKSKSVFKVKAFYPGYLTPEDFVAKIVKLLDQANLEGEPFTGILLDGLHNIFLQFKYLQESDMVWPLLYSILSRYRLTVVTTFTNFSINESLSQSVAEKRVPHHNPEDFILMQQGQMPFLHGLVKDVDYYFLLDEVPDDKNEHERKYWLSVKASPEMPPPKFLQWDRQNLIFTERETPQKVLGMDQ